MLQRQTLEYRCGGRRFLGQLVRDDVHTGRRPGVLVFPEAFGLDAHAAERAERLAALGYVALAADLHGEGACYPDLGSVGPAIRALYADRAEWRARARAALDALCASPDVDAQRLGAIGFCFGGSTALELARSGAPLRALVAFHAGLLPELPEDAGRIAGSVLLCEGAEDPFIKPEVVDAVIAALRRDHVDWQLLRFGNAGHSFTNPAADARAMPGFAYNAEADRRSWAAMQQLFGETLALR